MKCGRGEEKNMEKGCVFCCQEYISQDKMRIHVKTTYCLNKYKTEMSGRECEITKRNTMIWGCGHVSSGQFVYEYACLPLLGLQGTNIA